jgi:hypothetical protein
MTLNSRKVPELAVMHTKIVNSVSISAAASCFCHVYKWSAGAYGCRPVNLSDKPGPPRTRSLVM